jgi:hypothetical protein
MDVAKIRSTAAQSVAASTPTAVAMTTTEFQRGTGVVAGSSAITVVAGGYYRIDWGAAWAQAATAAQAVVSPKVNGAALFLTAPTSMLTQDLNTASSVVAGNGAVHLLAAGSVVTLEAVHTDSGALDLSAALAVTKVASL